MQTGSPAFYHLFDTPIGRCGIAWNDQGLLAVRLPAEPGRSLAGSLGRAVPGVRAGAPSGATALAIAGIRALLAGEKCDLRELVLDESGLAEFDRRVYALARAIPPGSTLTYGTMAEKLGDRGLARAVGQALGRNPWPIVVPCHRILAADGGSGGFSAPGGVETKFTLLRIEGARVPAQQLGLFG